MKNSSGRYCICIAFLAVFSLLLNASCSQKEVSEKFPHFKLQLPSYQMGADTFSGKIERILDDRSRDEDFDKSLEATIQMEDRKVAKTLDFKEGQAEFRFFAPHSGTVTVQFEVDNRQVEFRDDVRALPPWTSLIPPLLAILLALVLKEVLTSLFAGIFLGLFMMKGFSIEGFFTALFRFVDHYLVEVLTDSGHMSIIIFSLLIGGLVNLISENGGMAGLVDKFKAFAHNVRRTQFVTWLLGVLIFFDDYANTLIVGNTMRPLTDRFRISREKLAYLVDSTAAPIASVAFITTWIGAQLNYIEGASSQLPIEQGAYAIFFNSLQFAFYPVFTLGFVLMVVLTGRDFGPMLEAENNARQRKGSQSEAKNHSKTSEVQAEEAQESGYLIDALLPLLVLIGTSFGALIYTGYQPAVWMNEEASFFVKLARTIGDADAFQALLWGSLTGLLLALVMTLLRRKSGLEQTVEAVIEGFKSMFGALSILVLAWILAIVTQEMETARFLGALVSDHVNPFFLPAVVFVLAGAVAFSTGSSWGTMAILYPLILPVAYQTAQSSGLDQAATMDVFYHVVSVVLAGAVLGDHCSPLSDTTILSSMASKCNHIQHVRTQLPYAITVGVVSVLVGHLATGFGWMPVWLAFPLGLLVLYGILRYGVGKVVKT